MAQTSKQNASADKEVVSVVERNDYMRFNYMRQRTISLLMGSAVILSVLFTIFLFSMKPDVRVIAVDNDGRVVPVIALSDPLVSDAVIGNWVAEKVTSLYTYDFRNYQTVFSKLKADFTDNGFRSFADAMEKSNNLTLIREDQVIVTAVPRGAPSIVREGELNGRYAWKLEMPMLVTYEGASSNRTQELLITILVVRADLMEYPLGLAIEQIISRDG